MNWNRCLLGPTQPCFHGRCRRVIVSHLRELGDLMGGLITHLVEFAHPRSRSFNAQLLHFTGETFPSGRQR